MTTPQPLPPSTPSAEGVDPAGVHAFLDAVEGDAAIEPHSLMLLRHGRLIGAGWWAPYTAERPHLLYSLSKSFTSTALGLAVHEGLLGLDDRVADHVPGPWDARTRSMRVRHLAAMSTGHLSDTWLPAWEARPDDPVAGFLAMPPDREPGSVFAYNQPATFTLATILQRVTGSSLTGYLRPRLFEPLGIGSAAWQRYPDGRELGFTGLHLPTDAVARLGELYLRRGVWRGRRILPEAWVAQATRPQVATSGETNPDWAQGYGFQFWMSRHGYRGDGAYGQYCLVLPDLDAVVAYTGATVDMQAVLDAAWRHLLPAFGPGSREPGDADAALADRFARLALPPTGTAADAASLPSASFTGTASEQPSLTGVDVVAGPDGYSIVLREGDATLRAGAGAGAWVVTEAASAAGGTVQVAVSGGRLDAATLRFDVLFLETPHHLVVHCDQRTGRFEARWNTAPLHSQPLYEMRAPQES